MSIGFSRIIEKWKIKSEKHNCPRLYQIYFIFSIRPFYGRFTELLSWVNKIVLVANRYVITRHAQPSIPTWWELNYPHCNLAINEIEYVCCEHHWECHTMGKRREVTFFNDAHGKIFHLMANLSNNKSIPNRREFVDVGVYLYSTDTDLFYSRTSATQSERTCRWGNQ